MLIQETDYCFAEIPLFQVRKKTNFSCWTSGSVQWRITTTRTTTKRSADGGNFPEDFALNAKGKLWKQPRLSSRKHTGVVQIERAKKCNNLHVRPHAKGLFLPFCRIGETITKKVRVRRQFAEGLLPLAASTMGYDPASVGCEIEEDDIGPKSEEVTRGRGAAKATGFFPWKKGVDHILQE